MYVSFTIDATTSLALYVFVCVRKRDGMAHQNKASSHCPRRDHLPGHSYHPLTVINTRGESQANLSDGHRSNKRAEGQSDKSKTRQKERGKKYESA